MDLLNGSLNTVYEVNALLFALIVSLFVSNHLDWNQETCLAMLPTEFHVEDESSL